jgi:hypothetical protein
MHETAMLPNAQPAKPTQGSTASMPPVSQKNKTQKTTHFVPKAASLGRENLPQWQKN